MKNQKNKQNPDEKTKDNQYLDGIIGLKQTQMRKREKQ